MDKALTDKVFLVTGSSRGIGRKLAGQLLAAGALVWLNGRDAVRLELVRAELDAAFPGRVQALAGDVSEFEFCRSLAGNVQAVWGRLDGLVNNAGASMRGAFSQLSAVTVESIVRSNIQGSVYPTLACQNLLLASRGSVLFVSSLAGLRGFPGVSIYSAAKMALTALAQSVRAEWRGSGVHIGLVYLSFTENDPDKEILTADGRRIRHSRKAAMTQDQAAAALVSALRKRRKTVILTAAGKFLAVIQAWFPALADFVLGRSGGSLHQVDEKPAPSRNPAG